MRKNFHQGPLIWCSLTYAFHLVIICFCELYIINFCICIVFLGLLIIFLFLSCLASSSCDIHVHLHWNGGSLHFWPIHLWFLNDMQSISPLYLCPFSLPIPARLARGSLCWMAAKGRTNIELREQFILAEGVSQSMTAFKPKASPGASSAGPQRTQSVAGPITKVCLACPWSSVLAPWCIVRRSVSDILCLVLDFTDIFIKDGCYSAPALITSDHWKTELVCVCVCVRVCVFIYI